MDIKGQHIVGFNLNNEKDLSAKLKEIVEMMMKKYKPNDILIHQVIKADEREYVVILHEYINK